MKNRNALLLVIAVFLLIQTTSSAAQVTLKATVRDLAFMQGRWTVNHEWGDMEEFWGAPMGDNMISSYRCIKNGKVIFYEFVVIEQQDPVPVMILRHFKPGSIGWEDKEHPSQYPLVALKNNKATFKSGDGSINLCYALIGKNQLDVILEEKGKAGKLETTVFHYTRGSVL